MNILERIDALILSLFTKISHKFQIMTGRTNYFLAKVSLTLLGFQTLLAAANYWFPIDNRPTTAYYIISIFFVAVFISIDKNNCDKAEKSSFVNQVSVKPKFFWNEVWIFPIIGVVLRIFFMVVIIFAIPKNFGRIFLVNPLKSRVFEALRELTLENLTCYWYLIQVTPLATGQSKIRQWVDSLFLKPAPVRTRN